MLVNWYYVPDSDVYETYRVYATKTVKNKLKFLIFDEDWTWINASECRPYKRSVYTL